MAALRAIFSRLDLMISLLLSALRIAKIRLINANVQFGPGVRVDRGVLIRTKEGGAITIGADTHIWPNAIIEARGGSIVIGARGLVNAGCYIVATEQIAIGADALIAEYTTIRDQDHGHNASGVTYAEQGRVSAVITIGDNVWIGAKATVTKGVDIPAGSIIGANAVVTRSLTGGRIYVGIPARPLKEVLDQKDQT